MDLTRRSVLLGLAAATVAGCTSEQSPRPAAPDPDASLLTAAVEREQLLLATYQAVLHAPLLTVLTADVAEHLTRLAAFPLSQPAPSATAATVVAAAARNLARATAAAHAAAVPLASRTLAPVLASLAACASTHAAVL